MALTPEGRLMYDNLTENKNYGDFPKTHIELFEKSLAYYQYSLAKNGKNLPEIKKLINNSQNQQQVLVNLVKAGYVELIPVTYEDFLPKSAGGIFESNLSSQTSIRKGNIDKNSQSNKEKFENILGRKVMDSYEIYSTIEQKSKEKLFDELKINSINITDWLNLKQQNSKSQESLRSML